MRETISHSDEFITRAEAAQILNLSVRAIDKFIAKGKLTAYKMGGWSVRIRRSDVLALIKPIEVKAQDS